MSNQIIEARNSYIDQLLNHNKDLESKLSVCRERLEGASAYGQIAYTLAEYIKATERGVQVDYPTHAIAQIDLARGVAGRYEFPSQGRSIPVGGHKIE